jgi:DNA-binding CsgD family transcriptional regulator
MTKRPNERMEPLGLDGSALKDALDRLEVPSYVVDVAGIVRWTSTAAKGIFGDQIGKSYLVSIVDEDRDRARERFARRIFGVQGSSYEIAVSNGDQGRVRLRVHSTPLLAGGRVVGIFGLAIPLEVESTADNNDVLTRRQIEVVRLLAAGKSTESMAAELGIAIDTVRNHIRNLLRRLGVHSRIEAVVEAQRRGFLRT